MIGLASLLVGWLTLRPNRLASGTALDLRDSFGRGWEWGVIILCIIFLAAAFLKRKVPRGLVLGIAAGVLLVLVLEISGLNAGRLLAGSPALARVSLGSGMWLAISGIFIVIYASSRDLAASPPWRHAVTWGGLACALIVISTGQLDRLSIAQEFISQKGRFIQELQQHILLFSWSLALGMVIGIPLGIWASRSRAAERPIFILANITQTIPSLALFGLLIAPLSYLSRNYPVLRDIGIGGIGNAPALIALVIYSLLPIIQNTFTGLRGLNPVMVDAGKGMGMGRLQLLRRIELPLAAPLILEGVRTAAVQTVGNTAVAALIGAGGLGQLIFQGLGQAASDLIILGSIPIILLALLVDSLMRFVIKVSHPPG